MRYRWKTGMFAWVLFRVTGLALVGYLAMHIMVISNLHDPDKFDSTMKFLGSWQFRVLELGLFFVVLYHALNGIRVMIVDFWGGSVRQVQLFWGLSALGFVLFIAGAYPMLSHALYWKDVQQGKVTHVSAGYGAVGEDAKPKNEVREKRIQSSRKSRRTDGSRRKAMTPSITSQSSSPNVQPLPPPVIIDPIPSTTTTPPPKPIPNPGGGR